MDILKYAIFISWDPKNLFFNAFPSHLKTQKVIIDVFTVNMAKTGRYMYEEEAISMRSRMPF